MKVNELFEAKNWHGSKDDMGWYDEYKDRPIRVKVKNHSGMGGQPAGTYNIKTFKKIGSSKAEFTITSRGSEMTATVDLDKPATVLNKNLDRVSAMDFYCGSMPITARQAFNLFQSKSKLNEGVIDTLKSLFKKKTDTKPDLRPLTKEDRAYISKYFPANNADLTWTGKPEGGYVLPSNVTAHKNKGLINFYRDGDKLCAGVAYHKSESDAGNPKARPLIHWIDDVSDPANMEKLLKTLVEDEAWKAGWDTCQKEPSADPDHEFRKLGRQLDKKSFMAGFNACAKAKGVKTFGKVGDISGKHADLQYKETKRYTGL